jgi:cobalt-zinc-cadmium efflux system outer membrane protein
MAPYRLLLPGLFLLSGCLWDVREKTDRAVADLVAHPFDLAPVLSSEPVKAAPQAPGGAPASPRGAAPDTASGASALPPSDVQTASYLQAEDRPGQVPPEIRERLKLEIPPGIPGTEVPPIRLPAERAAKEQEVRRLFPELPPLPAAPTPLPGPNGRPYTLADLQQLAAANSPALRQAAADVEAARGSLIQARTYPNPTVGYEADPSNNNGTTGAQGFFIDQTFKTGGKLKLQTAAADMDLRNAELALRRARSDLATQVRTAYFNHLAAQETVRVTQVLARFTDDVYRLQARLLEAGFAAAYEPTALRAQAYSIRLAYKQAVSTYIASWQQLVAAVGVVHLPLSQVDGRIDRFIPLYDYDAVLARVLSQHTDVLTASNAVHKARYNLKLAQVTPVPDIDVRAALLKEFAQPPFTVFHTVQVGIPLPVWDRNKGNIIAAQAALERASEEPHRVAVTLTGNVAAAFAAYKNNLAALEYYRRHILPDLVQNYRGVLQRRQIDPGVAFNDLVTAQQLLATNVTAYLTVLGQLWASVVSVADLFQTDDLFQVGQPLELPPIPDLGQQPTCPCPHGGPASADPLSGITPACAPAPAGPPGQPGLLLPAPAAETTLTPAPPAPQLPAPPAADATQPPLLPVPPLSPSGQRDGPALPAPSGTPPESTPEVWNPPRRESLPSAPSH